MVPIRRNLAHRSNYGGTRTSDAIKYIVIHYTGNDGDTDEANAKYFQNNVIQTSAHYFVDDDSITMSVPEEYIAYHCGAKTYKHKYCRNSNSIGIEICDDVRNGVIYPSEKTIQNTLDLVRHLMQKYNIPTEHIIRHYDVTGKICPEYWVDDEKWKKEFWNRIEGETMTKEDVIKIIQEYEAAKGNYPVSDWAKSHWDKAQVNGILDGTRPKSPVTREQLAAVLDRLNLL